MFALLFRAEVLLTLDLELLACVGMSENVQLDYTNNMKVIVSIVLLTLCFGSGFFFRFQSSKSGKIYLHNDIRLLFSRKSIEVDTGIPYELKSFTEVPRNPKYSPRV